MVGFQGSKRVDSASFLIALMEDGLGSSLLCDFTNVTQVWICKKILKIVNFYEQIALSFPSELPKEKIWICLANGLQPRASSLWIH